VVCLYAGAGYGKSEVIAAWTAYTELQHEQYMVVSPTGVAATQVGGCTMHAFAMMNSDGVSLLTRYPEMVKELAEVPGIIVDEAFMADATSFNVFLKLLCNVPYNPTSRHCRVSKEKRCPHTGGRLWSATIASYHPPRA